MFAQEVSIPLAFAAGILSFFSPCILPMIPIYIMYLTGNTSEEHIQKRLAFTRTLGFIIGFTIIFMILGLSASALGQLLARHHDLMLKISGIIMIVFGLHMTGLFKLKFMSKSVKQKSPQNVTSFFSAMVMGIAFAAGWTPCFGPVLASIIIFASTSSTIMQGVGLLVVYSIGLAIPFLLTSLFINQFNRLLLKTNKIIKYMPLISGLLLILFGILVFTNSFVAITRLIS